MAAEDFIRLLAVAFNAKQLYVDPSNVTAFTQAIGKLGELANQNLVVGVTVEGFRAGSDHIEVEHGAAVRLSQLLFASKVESLALTAAPTPAEVIEFFNEIEAEATEEDDLDLATRLDLVGISALRLRMRDVLEDRGETE